MSPLLGYRWLIPHCILTWQKKQGSSLWSLLVRALIPLMTASCSKLNFPPITSLLIPSLGIRILTYEFWEDTYILSITYLKARMGKNPHPALLMQLLVGFNCFLGGYMRTKFLTGYWLEAAFCSPPCGPLHKVLIAWPLASLKQASKNCQLERVQDRTHNLLSPNLSSDISSLLTFYSLKEKPQVQPTLDKDVHTRSWVSLGAILQSTTGQIEKTHHWQIKDFDLPLPSGSI